MITGEGYADNIGVEKTEKKSFFYTAKGKLAVFFFIFLFFSFLFYYPKESYAAISCSLVTTDESYYTCAPVWPPDTGTDPIPGGGIITTCTITDISCPTNYCGTYCEYTGDYADFCSGNGKFQYKTTSNPCLGRRRICTTTWSCPASQCVGCTYYGGGVSCSSTVGSCVYGTSYLSNTCAAGCVPTATTTTTTTAGCVAGTGSTNASCGGFAYNAIQPSSGLCCEYTYRCVSGTCTAACHDTSIDQSLCGGGISCPRCNAGNTCETYTYTGGPTCTTDCSACPGGGGGTCMNTKLKPNPKTG